MPHPYSNVVDFEKRIRQPVGRTWNNVATYKKLVKPKIVTRLGKVIAPIDKSETFKKATFDVKPAESNTKGGNRTRDFDGATKKTGRQQKGERTGKVARRNAAAKK